MFKDKQLNEIGKVVDDTERTQQRNTEEKNNLKFCVYIKHKFKNKELCGMSQQ